MLYIDRVHFPAVDRIMEKCGLFQMAYDLHTLENPELYVRDLGPEVKNDRKIVEIWWDDDHEDGRLTGIRTDYRVRRSDVHRSIAAASDRFAKFGW